MCSNKWSDRLNDRVQSLHRNGLMPVCLRKWRVSSSDRANRHWQPFQWQAYGFSPNCKEKTTKIRKMFEKNNWLKTHPEMTMWIPTCVRSLMCFEMWTFRINFIASNGIASMAFAIWYHLTGYHSIMVIGINWWFTRAVRCHRQSYSTGFFNFLFARRFRLVHHGFGHHTNRFITTFRCLTWTCRIMSMRIFSKWNCRCSCSRRCRRHRRRRQGRPSILWNVFHSNEIVPSCDSFFLYSIVWMSPICRPFQPCATAGIAAVIVIDLFSASQIAIQTQIRTWPNWWTCLITSTMRSASGKKNRNFIDLSNPKWNESILDQI